MKLKNKIERQKNPAFKAFIVQKSQQMILLQYCKCSDRDTQR